MLLVLQGDSGIPATEKWRAVGLLCCLQRAREEKPLLLLEMSACSKTLLLQQNNLTQSVAWVAHIGRRAMLLKKLEQLQLLMEQLWNIFRSHLPDLTPLGRTVGVACSVPVLEDGDELAEVLDDNLDEADRGS